MLFDSLRLFWKLLIFFNFDSNTYRHFKSKHKKTWRLFKIQSHGSGVRGNGNENTTGAQTDNSIINILYFSTVNIILEQNLLRRSKNDEVQTVKYEVSTSSFNYQVWSNPIIWLFLSVITMITTWNCHYNLEYCVCHSGICYHLADWSA